MIKAMVDIRDEDVLSLHHVFDQFVKSSYPNNRVVLSRMDVDNNTYILRVEKWGPKKGYELQSECYFYSNAEIYEYLWRRIATYMP